MAAKPYILLVDDDAQVLRALKGDMRAHYKDQYLLVDANSPEAALDVMRRLRERNEWIALIISDQRMPGMDGVALLAQSKEIFPEARRVLLTAYADTDAAIRAINQSVLHYYLAKPWEPAADRLYPVCDDLLADYEEVARKYHTGMRMVGYNWSQESHKLKEFLTGNLVPYQFVDAETEQGKQMLASMGKTEQALPMVILEDGAMLERPNQNALSELLGLSTADCALPYDVAIIGAGPSGLAAAVYGASEGLRTLLIEKGGIGGQAGTSSRIENYLGFPQGISGEDLSRRAIMQAKRLGAEFMTPFAVSNIEVKDGYKKLTLGDDRTVMTKAVVIATGVEYRHLEAEGVDRFNGAGVYYGAANTEAQACAGKPVFIVGGGNSAGQAAMYLSRFASKVTILVRAKDGVKQTMSQYLVDQIKQQGEDKIEIRECCVVKAALGKDHLECLRIHNVESDMVYEESAVALFVFIGTRPITDWIGLNIFKTDKGYIQTGRDLSAQVAFKKAWKLDREPYLLETCAPGVFAAGDVRSGAMNRVASAVGEGAMAIKLVHEYLAGG